MPERLKKWSRRSVLGKFLDIATVGLLPYVVIKGSDFVSVDNQKSNRNQVDCDRRSQLCREVQTYATLRSVEETFQDPRAQEDLTVMLAGFALGIAGMLNEQREREREKGRETK